MAQKRILIVDDDAGLTQRMKTGLETTGDYVVRTVNDAPRAVATAQDFRPDLIFLDIMMPKMDGGDVAFQMQAIPSLRHVPIVYLTAIVTKNEAGAHATVQERFLAKPAELPEVMGCIKECLG